MISTLVIRVFFLISLIVYLIGFISPLIIVKRSGKAPHGNNEGASILTKLSSISIVVWFLYIILFTLIGEPIRSFLLITFLNKDYMILMGMVLVAFSFVLEGLGTYRLRENFRIELPKDETELVTAGIYQVTRNPIVLEVFLLLTGSFFMLPTIISLMLNIINILTFHSKVKDEEKFLVNRFGSEYKEYKRKVGRYLSAPWKKRGIK